jgi:uncharacterized protein
MLDYQNRQDQINSINTSVNLAKHIIKVYKLMFLGLILTTITSVFVIYTPLINIFANRLVPFLFIIAEFGVVIYLSRRILKLSASVARFWFIIYSVLNGITLSIIFLAYTATSIAGVFVISAAFFGFMALYGTFTKQDLTHWGNLLLVGLITVIVALIINVFLGSSTFGYIISFAGVAIFLGLTAYDNQKIKNLYYQHQNTNIEENLAVYGALILYLDFINLFLFILRILGRRR